MIVIGWTLGGPGARADAVAAATPVRVSSLSPFSPDCSGAPLWDPVFVNSEVEPRVAVDPGNPDHLVGVWQQDRWMGGAAQGILTGTSFDGGATWTISQATVSHCTGGMEANGADYIRTSDPWVSLSPNGVAYLSAISLNGQTGAEGVLVSQSVDGGLTWGEPTTVGQGDLFTMSFIDKESITADPYDPNFAYAVWVRVSFPSPVMYPNAAHASSFRTDILLSRTTDGGQSWEPEQVIYAPLSLEVPNGNIISVLPGGDLVDLMVLDQGPSVQRSTASIALIRSEDRGATWSAPSIVARTQQNPIVDPDTGFPVRTGQSIPDVAADPSNGNLYVVWTDASFNSPPMATAMIAVAFSQSTDGGLTWSAPIRISQVPSVAAFTPSVAVADDGTVGVTYYDFRSNTADPATLPTDYWFVHCHSDCANTDRWAEDHVAGPFDMTTAPVSDGYFLGDYEGLVGVRDGFLAFFAQTNSGDGSNPTDIFAVSLPRP